MPKSFGYLNEGNPLTIRDNEAQEMVNCAIERGWIEYKEYPVSNVLYDCVPNREVKLPDGTVLRIHNTFNSYARNGELKYYQLRNTEYYGQYGLKLSDSDVSFSVSAYTPLLASDNTQFVYGYYAKCKSKLVGIASDINTVKLPSPEIYFGNTGSGEHIDYNSDFIERSVIVSVKYNQVPLDKSQYSILIDENQSTPVIVLASPTTLANNTIEVEWNYAFAYPNDQYRGDNKGILIKEPQKIFYAVTVEDTAQVITGTNYKNPNFEKESRAVLYETYVAPSSVGFSLLTVSAGIPSNTGAVSPRLNVYRMPFGGSEYLFDFYLSSGVTNYLDYKKDDELDTLLETEGNSEKYPYSTDICSIMLHNDRLFLAEGTLLVFSKPSQFDQFPAENFYAFSDDIVDLCKYDSNLAVFTKTKSYIIYGAGTDGFVIAEVDWKTKHHIQNCARSIYTSLISLTSEDDNLQTRRNSILKYNHRYAQDISLRVRDTLNKGVLRISSGTPVIDNPSRLDTANRNTVIENRYYVAELRYYDSATATDNQVKTFNLVYDVIADGFCLYDSSVKNFNNQAVFKYRTKEFKMVTPPTHQAQYHKGIYVKGKGTFKVNVYSDGELLTSLTHTETDDSKPLRIILHNMGNKRGSTISLEFIGTQGAQIHDWEVYD